MDLALTTFTWKVLMKRSGNSNLTRWTGLLVVPQPHEPQLCRWRACIFVDSILWSQTEGGEAGARKKKTCFLSSYSIWEPRAGHINSLSHLKLFCTWPVEVLNSQRWTLFLFPTLPDAPHGGDLAQNKKRAGNSLVNFSSIDCSDCKKVDVESKII